MSLYKKYTEIAIKAAIEAGREIMRIYNDPGSDFSIEKKSDNSPITIADKKSHQIIVKLMDETGFPVLSEEGRNIDYNERKYWDTFWMIDPLDGTKEFINRNGEFTVNIALIKDNIPVLGVIYVPVTRELFFGMDGAGSYKYCLNNNTIPIENLIGKSIKLPFSKKRSFFTIAASRSHLSPATEQYIETIGKHNKDYVLNSRGSSLKICMVAEGSADVYPRFSPTMEWDTAAGHAIAKNAGKLLYCPDTGKELTYNKAELLNPSFIVE